jgi:hypothetical protein
MRKRRLTRRSSEGGIFWGALSDSASKSKLKLELRQVSGLVRNLFEFALPKHRHRPGGQAEIRR